MALVAPGREFTARAEGGGRICTAEGAENAEVKKWIACRISSCIAQVDPTYLDHQGRPLYAVQEGGAPIAELF